MRGRDLDKPHILGQVGDDFFVPRIPVAVHEDDCRGPDAVVESGLQIHSYRIRVRGGQDFAGGIQAFIDLDDPLIKHFRKPDVALEQLRPVLVTYPKRIGEPFGDD